MARGGADARGAASALNGKVTDTGRRTQTWTNRAARRRVRMERMAPERAAPRGHAGAIGKLVTINRDGRRIGEAHSEDGGLRAELEDAQARGGDAYLIVFGRRDPYEVAALRMDSEESRSNRGTVIGGLLVAPDEQAAHGERSGARIAADMERIEHWLNGNAYRVVAERLHRCAECAESHWAPDEASDAIIGLGPAAAGPRERFGADTASRDWVASST